MTNPDEMQEQKRMGTVMQVLAWIVLLGIGVAWFTEFLENPSRKRISNEVKLQKHCLPASLLHLFDLWIF